MKGTICLPLLLTLIVTSQGYNRCVQRTTNYGLVCVCNSTYCDGIPAAEDLQSGHYQLYTTSKENLGFSSTTGTFTNSSESSDAEITISDVSKTHQTIFGFGGAFTDSAGLDILELSEKAQEVLLEQYFGDNGVQYSIGRVPIGGTDFSPKGYTYCDAEDISLELFALQEEDYKYKIPFIKKAMELRGRNNINFFASAWSAPKWMKTADEYNGLGFLKDEYLDLWARYYLKFFDAYKENNITFWGVTTQNEPIDGDLNSRIPNNGFTAEKMKNWIKNHLGPAIRNSSYSDLKIIAHDDQRVVIPLLKTLILSDSEVVKYLDGIGVHSYTDFFIPAAILNMAKTDEKDLFRLGTEACTGYTAKYHIGKPIELGSWSRANEYLNSIMGDLQYDFIGWVDWNLALDETGGPNWIDNFVDSPIIVNGTADEFYKQPMFYAVGHFSKFLVPGSVRIDTETSGFLISSLGFIRRDNKIVVILRNRSSQDKKVKLNLLGSTEVITLEANSINSLLYEI